MYDKLSGLRKDNCQLSEIKKQGRGFDKCAFMYNEAKFHLWEAKLMKFQQSLKKLTDKFVNRLISAQSEVKKLHIWAIEYGIKNTNRNELEVRRQALPILNVDPLTAIEGLYTLSMSSSLEGTNKMQFVNDNYGRVQELKDDYQLSKKIRKKVHNIILFPTLKEQNIR